MYNFLKPYKAVATASLSSNFADGKIRLSATNCTKYMPSYAVNLSLTKRQRWKPPGSNLLLSLPRTALFFLFSQVS